MVLPSNEYSPIWNYYCRMHILKDSIWDDVAFSWNTVLLKRKYNTFANRILLHQVLLQRNPSLFQKDQCINWRLRPWDMFHLHKGMLQSFEKRHCLRQQPNCFTSTAWIGLCSGHLSPLIGFHAVDGVRTIQAPGTLGVRNFISGVANASNLRFQWRVPPANPQNGHVCGKTAISALVLERNWWTATERNSGFATWSSGCISQGWEGSVQLFWMGWQKKLRMLMDVQHFSPGKLVIFWIFCQVAQVILPYFT